MKCYVYIYSFNLIGGDPAKNIAEIKIISKTAGWDPVTRFFVENNVYIPDKRMAKEFPFENFKVDKWIEFYKKKVCKLNEKLPTGKKYGRYTLKRLKKWLHKKLELNKNNPTFKSALHILQNVCLFYFILFYFHFRVHFNNHFMIINFSFQ